jgi:hypothetical protein
MHVKRFLSSHAVRCALIAAFVCTACTAADRRVMPADGKTTLGTNLTYNYADTTADNYFLTVYKNATGDKKAARNRIIFELMTLVDDEYAQHERSIRVKRNTKDLIFKTTSIGLTGWASLAADGTAQALAALDTGVKGVGEAIDTTVYEQNSTEVLINTMRARRASVAEQIYAAMASDDDKYPLEAAMRDIVRYFYEGSTTSALAALAESTASKAKDQEETTRKARNKAVGLASEEGEPTPEGRP